MPRKKEEWDLTQIIDTFKGYYWLGACKLQNSQIQTSCIVRHAKSSLMLPVFPCVKWRREWIHSRLIDFTLIRFTVTHVWLKMCHTTASAVPCETLRIQRSHRRCSGVEETWWPVLEPQIAWKRQSCIKTSLLEGMFSTDKFYNATSTPVHQSDCMKEK